MKKYEYGFYGVSGEFFQLREYRFDFGKNYYVTANNAEEARIKFNELLNPEYCGNDMKVREIPNGHNANEYTELT